MGSSLFSPMAMDAIGEIFNISLGSSATAVSNMLARRVDITTPTVSVVSAKEFTLGDLQPAIGVKIDYVAGLNGSNLMLLKRSDVRAIVDILMGTDTKDEDFEINEMSLSAICEVMNQMMGAASTALSDFLSRMVNISTPQAFEIGQVDDFIRDYFPADGILVVVRFKLNIEDAVESEFMSAMSTSLARELLKGFGIEGADVGMPEEAAAQTADAQNAAAPAAPQPTIPEAAPVSAPPQQAAQPAAPAAPQPAESPAAAPVSAPPQAAPAAETQAAASMPNMQQQPYMMMPPNMAYPAQYGYPPMYMQQQPVQAPEPKVIQTTQPAIPQFKENPASLNEEQEGNLDLLMSVPVDVSVEIGRTRRRVKDILNYTKGSLVVLDRLAGDRADLYVNGKCIAKGDVVVVDDNFGLRIAEIVEPLALEDL